MSTMTAGAGRLQIGRVVTRTFALLGRRGVQFYALALILSAIPAVAVQWTRIAAQASPDGPQRFAVGGLALILALGAFVAGVWLQAALFKGTLVALDRLRVDLRELLQTTRSVILPLMVVNILNSLALGVGLVALVIPGVILLTMWVVVAPVCALERPSGVTAFEVAARLTKGRRWTIFWLLSIALLGLGLLSLITQHIIASIFYGGSVTTSPLAGIMFATMQGHGPLAFAGGLISALVNAAYVMLINVGVGVLYYELRTLRDGESPEDLATVFA